MPLQNSFVAEADHSFTATVSPTGSASSQMNFMKVRRQLHLCDPVMFGGGAMAISALGRKKPLSGCMDSKASL